MGVEGWVISEILRLIIYATKYSDGLRRKLIMKKILWFVAVLVLNCSVAMASVFLSEDWWKAATIEDVQKMISNSSKYSEYDRKKFLEDAVAYSPYPAVVQLLIKKGADVNARNYKGQTILMRAAEYSSPQIVKILIEAGADVNAHNDGRTALMIAARRHSPEMVKILIEAGADVNAKTRHGETAWSKYGSSEVNKLLENAGAKIPKEPKAKGKIRETTEQVVVGVIVVPLVLISATVYSITHGTSFEKGLACTTVGLLLGGCN